MSRDSIRRRKVIKSIPLAGIAGLAGCLGGSGGDGSGGDGSDGDGSGGDGSGGDGSGGDGSGGDGGDGGSGETYDLTIAGAKGGALANRSWQGVSRVLSEYSGEEDIYNGDIDLTIQETRGGGAANLRYWDSNQVDAGGVSNLELVQVYEEEGPFGDQPLSRKPYQGFYFAVLHATVFARDGSGLETFDDLPGVDFWPHAPGSSNRSTAAVAMGPQGLDLWDKVNHHEIGINDIAGAIAEGRVQAFVMDMNSYVGLGGGYVEQTDARADFHALKMSEEQKQKVRDIKGIPYYDLEPYAWETDVLQDDQQYMNAWGLGFQNFWDPETPSEVVHEITSLAIEHNDIIRDSQVGFAQDAEGAASLVMGQYPLHPGAAEAFKDHDVFDDSWTVGEQQ